MTSTFDIYGYKRRLEGKRNSLYVMKQKLKEAEVANKRKEEIESKLGQATQLRESLSNFAKILEMLYKRVVKEDIAYKNRRIQFLEDFINGNIPVIFPNENLTAKIETDFSRGIKTELVLYDEWGEERVPYMSEGRLLQQLLSFSGSAGITHSSGRNKMYLDEAFAVSSPENLPKIATILRQILDQGMQIIMVEQSEAGYKTLPRKEIHLTKDPISRKAYVSKVVMY